MKVKVKICGVRSIDAALAAIDGGADFIGLNLIHTSKRFITKEKAREISKNIKGKVKRVGVFNNQSLDEVNDLIEYIDLDYAQLHGDESPDFCEEINAKVIKAFQLESDFDFKQTIWEMKQFSIDYYLIDRINQGKGKMLSLEKANILAQGCPIIFAGGLTPENVSTIVEKVRPFAVDVAGGIETDGKQDFKKIKMFIKEAKNI